MLILLFAIASFLAFASAQTGLCPAPTGDFPNPSSELCTTFFRCLQGRPTLLRCPANQRFDFLFRICRSQDLVDCNSQLELFAAPAIVPGLSGLGSLGGGVGGLTGAGLGGVGALGGIAGGGLGAGLPNGGLINLLTRLDGADGLNGNDDGLATLLMVSALMNQRNQASQQPAVPPVQQVPANPVSPVYGQYPVNTVQAWDQGNNGFYQQQQGYYGAPGFGIAQGQGITTADGRTYVVVPQQYAQFPAQQGPFQGTTTPWAGNGLVPQGQGVNQSQGQTPNVGQNIGQGQDRNVGQNGGQIQGISQNGLSLGQGQVQNPTQGQIQALRQGQGPFHRRGLIAGQGLRQGEGQNFQGLNGQTRLQSLINLPRATKEESDDKIDYTADDDDKN